MLPLASNNPYLFYIRDNGVSYFNSPKYKINQNYRFKDGFFYKDYEDFLKHGTNGTFGPRYLITNIPDKYLELREKHEGIRFIPIFGLYYFHTEDYISPEEIFNDNSSEYLFYSEKGNNSKYEFEDVENYVSDEEILVLNKYFSKIITQVFLLGNSEDSIKVFEKYKKQLNPRVFQITENLDYKNLGKYIVSKNYFIQNNENTDICTIYEIFNRISDLYEKYSMVWFQHNSIKENFLSFYLPIFIGKIDTTDSEIKRFYFEPIKNEEIYMKLKYFCLYCLSNLKNDIFEKCKSENEIQNFVKSFT